MNYGLIIGCGMILFSIINNKLIVSGPTSGSSLLLNTLAIFLYVFSIHFFTKRYRNHYLEGVMTFGTGFRFGVLVIFFASLVSSFYLFLNAMYIDPEFIERNLSDSKEVIAQMYYKMGRPDSEIEQIIKEIDSNSLTPVQLAMNNILSNLITGSLVSLIIAALLRKKPNPFQTNNS